MNPILEVNDQPKISNKAGKEGWKPNNFSSLDVQKEQLNPYQTTHYNKGLQKVTWGPSGESKDDQQIRTATLPKRKRVFPFSNPFRKGNIEPSKALCGKGWSEQYRRMQQQLGIGEHDDPFAEMARRRENNIPMPKMSRRDY